MQDGGNYAQMQLTLIIIRELCTLCYRNSLGMTLADGDPLKIHSIC